MELDLPVSSINTYFKGPRSSKGIQGQSNYDHISVAKSARLLSPESESQETCSLAEPNIVPVGRQQFYFVLINNPEVPSLLECLINLF